MTSTLAKAKKTFYPSLQVYAISGSFTLVGYYFDFFGEKIPSSICIEKHWSVIHYTPYALQLDCVCWYLPYYSELIVLSGSILWSSFYSGLVGCWLIGLFGSVLWFVCWFVRWSMLWFYWKVLVVDVFWWSDGVDVLLLSIIFRWWCVLLFTFAW